MRCKKVAPRFTITSAGAGMGAWRYYMCPAELIKPDGWGLLWVNARGHVKPMVGPAALAKGSFEPYRNALASWRQPSDLAREQWLLVKLLNRVGDPEELNRKLRGAYAEQQRLAKECGDQRERLMKMRFELVQAQRELRQLQEAA